MVSWDIAGDNRPGFAARPSGGPPGIGVRPIQLPLNEL
jgi:hypothetical protein